MNDHSPIYVDEKRYNLYTNIHKGLRRAQTQLLARLGAANALDEAEVAKLLADMRLMNTMGRRHLEHENIHIHEPLEERIRGASDRLADDHEHHERDFDELDGMIAATEAEKAERRAPMLRALYLRYTQFLAEDFAHMLEEETETLALLHRLFTDAELQAIEEKIVASVKPELMMDYLRIMVPAMNPAERAAMVGGMRQAMPVEIFKAVVEAGIRPALAPAEWRSLEKALSIAA